MKKQFLLFLIFTLFTSGNLIAATAYDANGVKSSRQKERREKAKCNAIADNAAKELCLQELEDKAAKKIEKSREAEDSNQKN